MKEYKQSTAELTKSETEKQPNMKECLGDAEREYERERERE